MKTGYFWFALRRLVFLLPTLLGVLFLTFSLARILPGDPTTTALGPTASSEQRERFRERHGLNRPLFEQYVRYVGAVFQGDLGTSLHTNQPVIGDIRSLWPATFELTTAASLIMVLVGIPSGILAAKCRDRMGDHLARFLSLIGVSMPIFWLGLLMLLTFSLWLDLVPTGGRLSTGVSPPRRVSGLYLVDSALHGDWRVFRNALYHLILPSICLSFAVLGVISRLIRSTLLDVLHLDYIQTARAKGLSEAVILIRHALRNALISAITIAGLIYGRLLGGAVLTETIFSWPGIGWYAADAILHLDYPSILGVTVVSALGYMAVNLGIDTLYAVVDPRLRT